MVLAQPHDDRCYPAFHFRRYQGNYDIVSIHKLGAEVIYYTPGDFGVFRQQPIITLS